MDDDEGARRSHGSMTSNWQLQGLDSFWGDVKKMGYKNLCIVQHSQQEGPGWAPVNRDT